MSHFTVLVKVKEDKLAEHFGSVDEAVASLLAPYQENNMGDCPREYLEFEDSEDEYQSDYDNKTMEVIVSPDGKMYSKYDEEFYIRLENSYEKELRLPEGYELREVPIKERYATFEEYVADWIGVEERDPEKGRYGYWHNPSCKWDWYQIGGRWRGKLRIKEGASGKYGKRSGVATMISQDNGDPDGYLVDQPYEADVAKVKDIDFEGMDLEVDLKIEKWWDNYQKHLRYEEYIAWRNRNFDNLNNPTEELKDSIERESIKAGFEDAMKLGEDKDIRFFKMDVHDTLYRLGIRQPKKDAEGKPIVNPVTKKYDWEEDKPFDLEYLKTNCRFYWEFSTWAVLDDKGWHEKGEMGWFGVSSADSDDYKNWGNNYVERFILNEDPETTLVVVDCHI